MTRIANPFAPPARGSVIATAQRIKQWVREALGLAPSTVLSVSELACRDPGCPPRQTVVMILPEGVPPTRLAIHKAMAEVVAGDILAAVHTGSELLQRRTERRGL